MGADTLRTELKTTSDARVRAGVRAALEHIGERHGLTRHEGAEFADRVDEECCNALGADAFCDVTIEEREDRLEVLIRRNSSHRPAHNPPASKHEKPPGSANGQPAAVLVKHFHKKPAHH